MDVDEGDSLEVSDDVHIYDAHGNRASSHDVGEDDDYEASVNRALIKEEQSRRRLRETDDNGEEGLVSLRNMIIPDDDDYSDSIIPFLHIDGVSFERDQLPLLQKTRSMLEDHTVAVISLEHADDLSVTELIDFFTSVNYKTFLLGLRQLTRIDNLCPEVLENVFKHPSLRDSSNAGSGLFGSSQSDGPVPIPFFVAMPKGRHSKEEMTIQHMYDLFSGQGGGGQVKTANDRKMPGK